MTGTQKIASEQMIKGHEIESKKEQPTDESAVLFNQN